MRKPSKIVPTVVPHPRLALTTIAALLAIAACSNRDDRVARMSTSGAHGNGAATGSVSGFAASRGEAGKAVAPQMASAPAVSDEAMPVAAPASNAPPEARGTRRNASTGGGAVGADIPLGTPVSSIDASGAMLVRHGQASIEVRGVDAALISVRQAAAQHGGFIANTALRAGKDEQRSATLELRVPSDKFDGLLSSLSQLGKVESVTASAEDVGEEYVDLGARAANARKVEARLVEMLATRTGKLSDVLTVEQELARVRMEAERYDARIRYLERRASLSSLDITIHEPLALIEPQRGPGPMAEALAQAWSNLVSVAAWFVASLGLLIPLGVLIGAVVLVARKVLRGGKGGELVS